MPKISTLKKKEPTIEDTEMINMTNTQAKICKMLPTDLIDEHVDPTNNLYTESQTDVSKHAERTY